MVVALFTGPSNLIKSSAAVMSVSLSVCTSFASFLSFVHIHKIHQWHHFFHCFCCSICCLKTTSSSLPCPAVITEMSELITAAWLTCGLASSVEWWRLTRGGLGLMVKDVCHLSSLQSDRVCVGRRLDQKTWRAWANNVFCQLILRCSFFIITRVIAG